MYSQRSVAGDNASQYSGTCLERPAVSGSLLLPAAGIVPQLTGCSDLTLATCAPPLHRSFCPHPACTWPTSGPSPNGSTILILSLDVVNSLIVAVGVGTTVSVGAAFILSLGRKTVWIPRKGPRSIMIPRLCATTITTVLLKDPKLHVIIIMVTILSVAVTHVHIQSLGFTLSPP